MLDQHAAEELSLENEVAVVTLDSIGEGVLRAFLNRMAEKMTGWSREEAAGRPVTDVLRIIDGISGAASNVLEIVVGHSAGLTVF
jgi:PAS domain-containing protein